MGFLGVKWRNGNFFCSLSGTDDIRIKQRKNWSCGFNSRWEQNFESQKIQTTREWYFTHLPRRPHLGDRFRFGMRGDIADVITHDKFLLIGSGVSGVWNPQFSHFLQLSWSPLQQCKHYRATLRMIGCRESRTVSAGWVFNTCFNAAVQTGVRELESSLVHFSELNWNVNTSLFGESVRNGVLNRQCLPKLLQVKNVQVLLLLGFLGYLPDQLFISGFSHFNTVPLYVRRTNRQTADAESLHNTVT